MKPYYEDGSVTIYHGDCRDVLPSVGKVDLVVTDPPYGVRYVSGQGSHKAIANDDSDVTELVLLALAHLPLNRHFYVFGPFDGSRLTAGAYAELVWDKCKHSMGDLTVPWSASHERIVFGVWVPQTFKSMYGSGSVPARMRRGTVLSHPKVSNGRGALDHPTRKPVSLLRELIEMSSRHGEIVLDAFMGSGSTLEAAYAEGRKAIGIEVDERYCEIAATKFAQGVLAL